MTTTDAGREFRLFKNDYLDDISRAADYFRPVLDAALGRLPAGRRLKVLDAGCGNGRFTARLKQQLDCELYGIDASRYALDQARANGFDAVAQVGDLSLEPLPYPAESFDLVICKDVFEHLLAPAHLAGELARVLKPGGYLLAHCPNHFPLNKRLLFLAKGSVDTFGFFPGAHEWDYPHIRFFSARGLRGLLEASGFLVSADLSYFFPANFAKLGKLPGLSALRRRLVSLSPDLFAEGFTLLAQKKPGT